jgi:hypothetical protein
MVALQNCSFDIYTGPGGVNFRFRSFGFPRSSMIDSFNLDYYFLSSLLMVAVIRFSQSAMCKCLMTRLRLQSVRWG